MATANCVHPYAQHEQPGAHGEQWHGHHKAHWRVQCAVLSTPRTVCWCTCVHTSHLWLKVSPCVSFHIIHACALVSCLLSGLSSPVSLLLPPVPLPALPDVHPGAWWDLHWRSPVQLQLGEHGHSGLCHTPHRLWAQGDGAELNLATTSDIYFQNALDDTASFPNVPDVDDNELAEFLAVVVDRTGQPVEVRSNNDQFSCDIRNLKSAQSQFPLVTQPKRMISQTGGVCWRKDRWGAWKL